MALDEVSGKVRDTKAPSAGHAISVYDEYLIREHLNLGEVAREFSPMKPANARPIAGHQPCPRKYERARA